MDVFDYINHCNESFDFIFAGPPYALGPIDEIPKLIVARNMIAAGGFLY